MEQYEVDLIAKHVDEDDELKSLWEEHLLFEKQLERLEGKSYISPQDELVVKDIKKKKLAGKTRMQRILDKYRKSEG